MVAYSSLSGGLYGVVGARIDNFVTSPFTSSMLFILPATVHRILDVLSKLLSNRPPHHRSPQF
jgi:hypothetical protein